MQLTAFVSQRAIKIALTPGEPAGIGPDIVAKISHHEREMRIVVIADESLLRERAQAIGIDLSLRPWNAGLPQPPRGVLEVLHVPMAVKAVAGQLDTKNSPYVLKTLEIAADGCLDGSFDAMVTGPVSKSVINDAGIAFTGHTEFLASRTRTERVVMMLVGGGLRVALATTHLALREVASHIVGSELEATIRILAQDLGLRYGLTRPRIAVAGLNPHAGESGYLGREEIDVIAPVIDRLRGEGFALSGPLPADTLFTPTRLAQFDAVLSMYHDQGLPVLKYASFGRGINVTLGLPIIRTSVDHGTALDLAASGNADEASLLEALDAAAGMARIAHGMPRGASASS